MGLVDRNICTTSYLDTSECCLILKSMRCNYTRIVKRLFIPDFGDCYQRMSAYAEHFQEVCIRVEPKFGILQVISQKIVSIFHFFHASHPTSKQRNLTLSSEYRYPFNITFPPLRNSSALLASFNASLNGPNDESLEDDLVDDD